MVHKLGGTFAALASVATCAGVLLTPVAQATPIEFFNTSNTSGTPRFTIGCGSLSGSCAGSLEAVSGTSPLTWSSTFGLTLQGSSKANPTSEMNFVNGLLGTSFTSNSGNLGPSGNFTTDAQYFLVKVGNTKADQPYALLWNKSGGPLSVWFDATGKGGGLSHYISFGSGTTTGTPTPVPEPGIFGMFGVGLLLVGAGYGLRRRSV